MFVCDTERMSHWNFSSVKGYLLTSIFCTSVTLIAGGFNEEQWSDGRTTDQFTSVRAQCRGKGFISRAKILFR